MPLMISKIGWGYLGGFLKYPTKFRKSPLSNFKGVPLESTMRDIGSWSAATSHQIGIRSKADRQRDDALCFSEPPLR